MMLLSFYRLMNHFGTKSLLHDIKKAAMQGEIIVWSAGFRSWEFIQFLMEQGIQIRYVVDRDSSKYKQIPDLNLEVCSWENVKNKASAVCVLREKYYDEIWVEIFDEKYKNEESEDERREFVVLNVENYAPFHSEY